MMELPLDSPGHPGLDSAYISFGSFGLRAWTPTTTGSAGAAIASALMSAIVSIRTHYGAFNAQAKWMCS